MGHTAELPETLLQKIVDSLELTEDISILRRDATGLQHSNTEGKDAANLQLTCHTVTTTQLGLCDVTQFEVYREPQGKDRRTPAVIYLKRPEIVLCFICIRIISSPLVSAHHQACD